jgi:cyclase
MRTHSFTSTLQVRLLVVAVTMASAAALAFAQAGRGGGQGQAAQAGQGRGGATAAQAGPTVDNVELKVRHVQGNVHLIASGVGGNTAVQAADSGVLVVDPGFPQLHDKLVEAIRTISPDAIHYILNTHVHQDHAGGNERLAAVGPMRPDRNRLAAGIGGNTGGTTSIVAHENVYNRLANPKSADATEGGWPNDTFFTPVREVYFNGEAIQMFHVPAAHTDGDSIVFFRRSDVIATGDLFTTTMYPYIDTARGGHVNGIIAGLNKIIELAVPDLRVQEGGTLIIPGHGRLGDEQDVIEYRDMMTIIRDRIQALVDKGQSLDQVRAARPTLDWDARYGSDTGFWTTAMFVESIYNNLKGQ